MRSFSWAHCLTNHTASQTIDDQWRVLNEKIAIVIDTVGADNSSVKIWIDGVKLDRKLPRNKISIETDPMIYGSLSALMDSRQDL
jgi:hypothetical protein